MEDAKSFDLFQEDAQIYRTQNETGAAGVTELCLRRKKTF